MKHSPPTYWFLEIVLAFFAFTTISAWLLSLIFGRYWGGSLLPLVTFPFQILAGLVVFGLLFSIRAYTTRPGATFLSALTLSVLSSIAMFNWGIITLGGYKGP